jgi:putative membrane protein
MSVSFASAGLAAAVAMGLMGGLPVPAQAEVAGPVTSTQQVLRQEVSEQDRRFLRQAHQGNLAEIAAGELARTRGQAEVVRSLGAVLVTDHTRLDAAVRETAERLGVSLPTEPTPQGRAMLARLRALSGSAFDRAWIAGMIEGHRMSLRRGQRELREGTSGEVKQLVRTATPVVQEHLDRLLAAQRTVGMPRSVPAGDGGHASTAVNAAMTPWPGLGHGALAGGFALLVAGVLMWTRPRPWRR